MLKINFTRKVSPAKFDLFSGHSLAFYYSSFKAAFEIRQACDEGVGFFFCNAYFSGIPKNLTHTNCHSLTDLEPYNVKLSPGGGALGGVK